jgi:hypothetical protein
MDRAFAVRTMKRRVTSAHCGPASPAQIGRQGPALTRPVWQGQTFVSQSAQSGIVLLTVTAASTVLSAPAYAASDNVDHGAAQHHAAGRLLPDDICGPGASYQSWVNTVEVNHLTARYIGSFHFVDFETGYIHVDFVDPATPDVTQSRTETFNVNLTPGGTYTETSTYRQRDGNDLIIRFSCTLIIVDGVPRVEWEAFFLSGCPA